MCIGSGQRSIYWFRCITLYDGDFNFYFSSHFFPYILHFHLSFPFSFSIPSWLSIAHSIRKVFKPHIRCKVVAKWPHTVEKSLKIWFSMTSTKKLLLLLLLLWLLLGCSKFFPTSHYFILAHISTLHRYGLRQTTWFFSHSRFFLNLCLTEHQFRMQQNHCIDRTIFPSSYPFSFSPILSDSKFFFYFFSAVGVWEKLCKTYFCNNNTLFFYRWPMHILNSISMLNCWKSVDCILFET